MQQLRRTYGGNKTGHDKTIGVLNEVIEERFPDELARQEELKRKGKKKFDTRTAGNNAPSTAHKVTQSFLRKVEEGCSDLDVPEGLAHVVGGKKGDARVRGSRVPEWLVEAYDHAFAADGFLMDMYHWMVSMHKEQAHEPPLKNGGHHPAKARCREIGVLSRGFEGASFEVADLLRQQAAVVGQRLSDLDGRSWEPSADDVSRTRGEGEDDLPDGTLVGPGEDVIYRWVLYNAGEVAWRHRYLLRVGDPEKGIRTPPFVPVPDADPGGKVEIRCPMRAPKQPGTYRICMKMGWPDGMYCFPAVTLGAMAIIIVPPKDMTDWREPWSHDDR